MKRQTEELRLDIIDMISKWAEYKGYTPKIDEYCEQLQRSNTVIWKHIQMLKLGGYIEKVNSNSYGENRRITWMVTDKGQKALDLDTLFIKE